MGAMEITFKYFLGQPMGFHDRKTWLLLEDASATMLSLQLGRATDSSPGSVSPLALSGCIDRPGFQCQTTENVLSFSWLQKVAPNGDPNLRCL